jgi:hypothetical protein
VVVNHVRWAGGWVGHAISLGIKAHPQRLAIRAHHLALVPPGFDQAGKEGTALVQLSGRDGAAGRVDRFEPHPEEEAGQTCDHESQAAEEDR